MMTKEIYVLGVGHNTPVFIDLAEQSGLKVVGLYHYNDERTGQTDHGFTILGSFNDLFSAGSLEGKQFLLSMGDSRIRQQLTQKITSLGGRVPTVIHPTAVVSRFADISPVGVVVSALTHVQADTTIGEGTVLLSGVNINHTNNVGRYCFFAGGSSLGAYTTVDDFVFMGIGATTISSKVAVIGHHAYIAAGALLTKSVEPHTMMIGSPARVYKKEI